MSVLVLRSVCFCAGFWRVCVSISVLRGCAPVRWKGGVSLLVLGCVSC